MRWLFLLAAIATSACVTKRAKTNTLQTIERDTGILLEEDLEGLPES
jgi:hypothetical protein